MRYSYLRFLNVVHALLQLAEIESVKESEISLYDTEATRRGGYYSVH